MSSSGGGDSSSPKRSRPNSPPPPPPEPDAQPDAQPDGQADAQADGQSDGTLSQLPPEIIIDILGKVSIKELSRCRLVRKSWYHRIRDEDFMEEYADNAIHIDGNRCLILQKCTSSELIDSDFETFRLKVPDLPQMSVTDHASNGFLLLNSRTCVPCNRYRSAISYWISNPITGDYMPVPISPLSDLNLQEDLTIGFGYDPDLDICKIVRVVSFNEIVTQLRKIKVEWWDYTVGEWEVMEAENIMTKSMYRGDDTKIPLLDFDLISTNFRPSAFVDGAIHWMGYRRDMNDVAVVIAFRIDTEEFLHGTLPFTFRKHGNNLCFAERQPYLLEMRECLSVVHTVGYHEYVEVWVMHKYGRYQSWEKKFVINNILTESGAFLQGPYMPIEVMSNGEILIICFLNKKIGHYHPVTKVVKFSDAINMGSYYWRPLPHICSLKSPWAISK